MQALEKKIGWRTTQEIQDRLDEAMLSRLPREQRSYQKLLDSLVAQWLNGSTVQTAAPDPDLPAKQRRLLAATRELLASDDPMFLKLLTALVDGFKS